MESFEANIAVLIAIDGYQHPVTSLTSPVNDAKAIASVLSKQHGFKKIKTLYDSEATLDGMQQLLDDLQSEIDRHDRVFFYFAGHGVASPHKDGPLGYILPQDANKNDVKTQMSMEELQMKLSRLVCRHMLVVLDCCFAGALRLSNSRSLVLAPASLNKQRLRWFIEGKAWQAIASSAHNQEAIDVAKGQPVGKRDDGNDHSPFALALLDGMQGKADDPADGITTATELFLHIERALFDEAQNGGRAQKPVLWPLPKHEAGEFVFRTPGTEINLPPAPVLDENANPWKGLKSYDPKDQEIFFGRRGASERLLAHILNSRLTLVSGASGIGKSSLVRAGVIWRLEDHAIRCVIIRPGTHPFEALASTLKELASSEAATPTADELRKSPDSLCNWIDKRLQKPLLIVVDQAEELITYQKNEPFITFLAAINRYSQPLASNSELVQFTAEGAAAALRAQGYLKPTEFEQVSSGQWRAKALKEEAVSTVELSVPRYPLRLVLTVRSEYEAKLRDFLTASRSGEVVFRVPRLTQDELRRVIKGPASVRAIRFESDDLIDRLINDVVEMPGALPILSFALSEMYRRYIADDHQDRTLRESHYGSSSTGIAGLLHERADAIVNAHGERTARRVLERFVSNDLGTWTRRRVPVTELDFADKSERERAEGFLDELKKTFLVVTDQTGDVSYHELAHDTLIMHWQTLLTWARKDATRIADLHKVTEAAADWQGLSKSSSSSASSLLDRTVGSVRATAAAGCSAVTNGLWVDKGLRRSWNKLRAAARSGWRGTDSGELWSSGNQLKSVRALLENTYPGLNAQEYAFANASKSRAHRNTIIWASTIGLMAGGLVFGAISQWETSRERTRTIVNDVAREWLAPPRTNPGSAAAYIAEQLHEDRELGSDKLRWTLLQAMHTVTESRIIGHKIDKAGGPQRLIPDPTGKYFMAASKDLIAVWEAAAGGKRVFSKKGEFEAADVSWSSNHVLSATKQAIELESFAHERRTFAFEDKWPVVKFNSSGTAFFAFGKDSGRVSVWPVDAQVSGTWPSALAYPGATLTDLAWTQDGSSIIAVARDGSLITWQMSGAVPSGKPTRRVLALVPQSDFLWEIAIDGNSHAATWVDYWAKKSTAAGKVPAALWDLTNPDSAASRLTDALKVSGMTFGPKTDKGTRLAVRSDSRFLLINTANFNPAASVKAHNSYIRDIRFSPDGKKIVTASDDRAITIWDGLTGERLQGLMGHLEPVRQAYFMPDGDSVVSLAGDRTVRRWTLAGAWNERKTVCKSCEINTIAFDATGSRVAAASDDGYVRVWTIGSDRMQDLEFDPRPNPKGPIGIAFSPDGRWLAAGGGSLENPTVPSFIRVFNLESGAAEDPVSTPGGRVRTIAFSPGGTKLLASLGNGTAAVYPFQDGKLQNPVILPHGGAVTSASWNFNGSMIATSSTDKTARVWFAPQLPDEKWTSGEPLLLKDKSFDVTWAHNSNLLAAADGDANIFLYASGSLRKTDKEKSPEVKFLDDRYAFEIEFLPNDRQIAARLNDGTLIVHDLELGHEVYEVPSNPTATAFAISPGGTRLAAGYRDGSITLMSMPKALDELASIVKRDLPRCLTEVERNRYASQRIGDFQKDREPSADGATNHRTDRADALPWCKDKWPADIPTFELHPWTREALDKH